MTTIPLCSLDLSGAVTGVTWQRDVFRNTFGRSFERLWQIATRHDWASRAWLRENSSASSPLLLKFATDLAKCDDSQRSRSLSERSTCEPAVEEENQPTNLAPQGWLRFEPGVQTPGDGHGEIGGSRVAASRDRSVAIARTRCSRRPSPLQGSAFEYVLGYPGFALLKTKPPPRGSMRPAFHGCHPERGGRRGDRRVEGPLSPLKSRAQETSETSAPAETMWAKAQDFCCSRCGTAEAVP